MSDYTTHELAMIVRPFGEGICTELATIVRIDDEGAGPYVEIEQTGRSDLGKVTIDRAEWPHIRAAVEKMLKLCEVMDKESGNG
jgi:hypothetical protein